MRRRRGSRSALALAVAAVSAAACALFEGVGPWGMVESRDFVAAPSELGKPEDPREFRLALPLGTDRNQFALAARERLHVGRGATVTEPRFSQSVWGAPAACLGDFHVSEDARIGSIYALGPSPLVLEAGVAVSGYVKSAAGLRKAPGSFIRSGHIDGVPAFAEEFAWRVEPTGARRTAAPQTGSALLQPGIYEHLSIGPEVSLSLGRGRYYIERLELEPGGTLTIENSAGPVYLWIESSLKVAGKIERTADEHNVLWGFGGSVAPHIGSAFVGVLVAPRAHIRLPRAAEPHRGSFFARSIELEDGARVEHWGFFVAPAQ